MFYHNLEKGNIIQHPFAIKTFSWKKINYEILIRLYAHLGFLQK